MNDIYNAPDSDLSDTGPDKSQDSDLYGSVEKGLKGEYSLTIGSVFRSARDLMEGSKTILLLAFGIYVAIAVVGQSLLAEGVTAVDAELAFFAVQIFSYFIVAPIGVGLLIIAVRRAARKEAQLNTLFNYFSKALNIGLCLILVTILVGIGFLLLILPGIYLGISYMYAPMLIAEKDMRIWEAMETSRKAIHHRWFTVFGVMFIGVLLLAVSMIPFFIGLIWSVPFFMLCSGTIYLTIFGAERETLA